MGDFNAVEVTGAYDVKIVSGTKGDIQIESDDNILPLIKTEVKDGRLVVSSNEKFSTGKSPTVSIVAANIQDVSGTGASNFEISGIRNASLKLTGTGASKFQCAGETNKLTVDVSGAGSVDARELHAKDAIVKTNGASSVTVFATETLDANVNGVGSVDYYGNPKVVNKKVDGMGSLNAK
ncbi:MAG: hypothetical protein QOH96_1180 [Blastocatellia bacterium]|nr:hypothetical protein [Blastocatellia bacterium]